MRDAVEGLDSENRRAWQLFSQVATRFNVDTQSVPLVIQRLTAEDDAEEFGDLMSRLAIIHDIRNPPKKADG